MYIVIVGKVREHARGEKVTDFEELYSKYFNDVFLFICRLSGDKYLAEDITSETFLKAIKSVEDFRGDSDIRTWLCQIAKNIYYSHLRKNKRIINVHEDIESKDNTDIERKIVSKEETMKAHKIIHKLQEPYKEVFSLRVFGELSFKEIGKLFGKTDNWACVTYHRARNKIKEQMED